MSMPEEVQRGLTALALANGSKLTPERMAIVAGYLQDLRPTRIEQA